MSNFEPTVLLGDVDIPVDRYMFQGIKMLDRPIYNESEVCKFFFAKKAGWVVEKEKRGKLVLNGEPLVPTKVNNLRVYNLADIELVAHALAQNSVIPGERLRVTLKVLRATGSLWLYL